MSAHPWTSDIFDGPGRILPAPLARFHRIFLNFAVQLFEMERADIERKLIGGKIDLAVILTSNLSNADEIEELIRSRRRLWAPRTIRCCRRVA